MPDYEHSILNLITSILKHYGVQTPYSSLEKVDNLLKRQYKNVVLVILDGMGKNILEHNSPNGLFFRNKREEITSVYPSTTTAAMTTYYSGKPPIETGWLAWSQYFKEYGRNIDVLQEKDSCTTQKLQVKNRTISDIIGYKTIYEQIEEQNKNIKTYEIVPTYCAKKTKMTMTANTVQEMCESIVTLCKNSDPKFILAYQDNPDSIIHKNGCYSEQTKQFLLQTEQEFEKMLQELKDTDTLVLVSADHGHQDIQEIIDVLELEEIQDCLIMPPTLEARMVGFFVKEDRKQEFEEKLNQIVKDKYRVYSKEEVLKSNLFGYGKKHKKIEEFIGDYIAVAIADTQIKLGTYLAREMKKPVEHKSAHCGLTKNEMLVPLIAFEMNKKNSKVD